MQNILLNIEALGRRLPHPTLAFAALCCIIIVLSGCLSLFGIEAVHPITKEAIQAQSLLSQQGFLYILGNTTSNFMNFAPLGPVIVAMFGIGLADHSGYLPELVQKFARSAPKSLLSYTLVFTGVLSNLAADAGYIVLIPLAALIYTSFGRHPLAGIAAAFAGVSGGYSANLMIGPVDIVLSGITVEAAQIVAPSFEMAASSNYWFLLASTGIITLIGGLITDKIVEPYLNTAYPKKASTHIESESTASLKPDSNQHAFRIASWVGLGYITLITAILSFELVPTKNIISGIVVLIAFGFALLGLVYGRLSNQIQDANNSWDWTVGALEKTMVSLAGYLVLMFFAAQFVAYFNWTQIGIISAIKGAEILTAWSIPPLLLLILLVFFSAFINLFIGSASAKWALMAPILVPLLYLLEIDPAFTQLAYRIGDSSTNIITPLMPYFALILAYTQQHDKSAHLGTIMAMMVPYSIGFLGLWVLLLTGWIWAGIPIGF